MDYSRFVALRRPLWEELEQGLERLRRHEALTYEELEALAMLYRQLLQDHAWARARYPHTGVARRLERLAVAGTGALHRDAAGDRFSPRRFLLDRFPQAVRAHLPLIGLSLALFLVMTLVGLGVAVFEPGVAVALLGPETVAGLRDGRLWTEALTTTVPPAISSSAIARNNMSVAITAWAGGLLGGVGSLWITLLNGYMLGAVLGVTLHFSLAGELLEFVAAHGPLEITLILVCAGAGLGIGRALLVAGERPRGQALQQAGREALVVLAGCLPWFLVLGAVEGLVSPSPAVPWGTKLFLGLSLQAVFLGWALGAAGRSPREAPA
ncbi:MAG TPA: stage II sporulation protein M [Thermoanaerobaculia bacterium]|nr:stage II sporulation protein M [Thermoanaerobaculia bacterium]